ncbi:fumarylacetoacetate hydrolase family protein [Sabulicella glaciei]|uniref:Fumarylacetoacetate hydrolase family protein n=1 Tax=Sabulicella glaciei TaxID=2984948 RepID=A0ABT3NY66_9PROT|nr:fumarylacetoacetate hydrolase family protein [Roseococcus sp. MDT2-1-1]MCW8087105.1 fumarylacetoacetate hydrolase family protein [Roseococcus sp. MDT2-1-1]
MRLLSFEGEGGPRVGAALGDSVVDLAAALAALGGDAAAIPGDMTAFLARGEAATVAAARALAFAARGENAALRRPLSSVTLLAPVPRPGKILGIGRNYGAHAKEVGGPVQEIPRIFFKPATAVAPPGALTRIPDAVRKPDWEAEIGVVIGRPARAVREADALRHVAGYTLLDDVSAREFQFDVQPPQTSFAKGMDGFCPMGPWIVTPEEAGEPWDLQIRCWLNGELVQEGNTRDLIFPVTALIAHLSRYMTLEPGDVIATGTPAGSGAFRDPPRWLRSGDRLRIECPRIGVLEHGIA